MSDGAHEGGTPGFYFLPPMVGQPIFSGTFDADIAALNPQIAVCDVTGGPDFNCGAAAAGATRAVSVFTTTTTHAITLDPTTPQYQVLWDTKGAGFVAGNTYRLHVTGGATGARRELGFADVLLTTTPGQVKHMATGDLVVLKDGRTLAVDFRIETGIPGGLSVTAATPSVTTGGTDQITATVEDLHAALLPGARVAWSVTTIPSTGVADANQPLNPISGQTGVSGTTSTTFKAGSAPGTAAITAASAGISTTAAVTVAPAGLVFISVTAGTIHSCGVTTAGSAYCWGNNDVGELGNGNLTTVQMTPVAVGGGLQFAALSAGQEFTCGVTLAGAAYCWGANNLGQLGNGTVDQTVAPLPHPSPTAVAGGLSFASVSAGTGHVCGITTAGAAFCWGENSQGGLGDGQFGGIASSPVAVLGGPSFAAISAGELLSCGIATVGAAYCWGGNGDGELGDGDAVLGRGGQASPVSVVGGLTFTALSTGFSHTCGVTLPGAAYCWGRGGNGERGDGTFGFPVNSPVAVVGGLTFAGVSASGLAHTCGVASTGAAYCWGYDGNGQLGDGAPALGQSSPVAVVGGLTFAAVSTAAGGEHTCGVTTTGVAYCWGLNTFGQLGNGTQTSSSIPVKVADQP
jgi:alpha-tubulin suppressor-like RCC1 family protein